MKTLAALFVLFAAASAGAQATKSTDAKAPGTKATDTKAAGTKAPVTKAGDAKAPDTKAAVTKAPETKAADTKAADTKQAQGTKAPAPGTKAPAAPNSQNTKQAGPGTPAAATLQTPTIMREVYGYDVEGRRDPFISLLSSSTLRPTVADLYLTSILYDENGSNSIAMMRDPTDGNKQYRVTTGQTIGRMKVALIKRRVVIFSIEEFGLNRQDSLILGDTTKARAK
jgi:hypothetical protein